MNAQTDGLRAAELFTIGHSNHNIETFCNLLKQHNIQILVDVRSQPYSRHAPHFNRRGLEKRFASSDIRYVFMGDLLGGRPGSVVVDPAKREEFYSSLAKSADFRRGITALKEQLQSGRVAVMCAEEDPIQCHRRLLIARALIRHGRSPEKIFHIRKDGGVQTEDELAHRQTQL